MKFKMYKNKDGKKCKIAIVRYFENKKVIFNMKYPNVVEPHYYIPDAVFKNPDDVVKHILDNLTTDGIQIEVTPLENKVGITY